MSSGSPLAQQIVRKRVEETMHVSSAPEVQEARLQQVEAMASATSQMTVEQLKTFYLQHHALVSDVGAKQAEQHAMAAQLLQFQNQLNEQQRALDLKVKEQEEKTRAHEKALHHVSHAFGDTSRTIAELRAQVESDARRQSGRWSAFVNSMTEQVSSVTNDAVASATAAAAAATVAANSPSPLQANEPWPALTGIQQVPEAPTYSGATRKDKRVFMDSYMAYVRRLTVLNQGSGRKIVLMPLAACVDPTIIPRVCDLEMGKSFEDVTEEDWRSYFLQGTKPCHQNIEALERAMQGLVMTTRLADGESRVMQLVADFYKILESQEMPTLYDNEPKKCIKYLVQAVRPVALRQIVEKEMALDLNRHLRRQWREFVIWLTGQAEAFIKYEAWLGPGTTKSEPPRRNPNTNVKAEDRKPRPMEERSKVDRPFPNRTVGAAAARVCLKCKSQEHTVWKCPKAEPGEAHRLWTEQKASGSGGEKKAADYTSRKTNVATKANGFVSLKSNDLRNVPCQVGQVHLKAVLDSGADQSVVCPRLVSKLEKAGTWMTGRHLDQEVELTGFQAGLRVKICREVKLNLEFSTYAGRLLLKNVVCWVASAPLADGLGDILVSRREMEVLGYNAQSFLDRARENRQEYDMECATSDESPTIALLSQLDQPPRICLRCLRNISLHADDSVVSDMIKAYS